MNKERVFVYGTLKRGNSIRGLDRFGPANTFISEARTYESVFDLYSLGPFPAVTEEGEYHIQGEVWEVDKETFKHLDAIEGYPDFYNRRRVNTTAGEAWMYFIPNLKNATDEAIIKLESDTNTISWEA